MKRKALQAIKASVRATHPDESAEKLKTLEDAAATEADDGIKSDLAEKQENFLMSHVLEEMRTGDPNADKGEARNDVDNFYQLVAALQSISIPKQNIVAELKALLVVFGAAASQPTGAMPSAQSLTEAKNLLTDSKSNFVKCFKLFPMAVHVMGNVCRLSQPGTDQSSHSVSVFTVSQCAVFESLKKTNYL